ncbi:MAG: NAD(P)H-hydrate dehydratase [Planctomycetota bacterium]
MTAWDRSEIQHIETLELLGDRAADGHKGDYGRVLVVGGSRGMVGAVALAANAALRGGAGLVTFAAPDPVQPTIAALAPCATSIALACDDAQLLTDEAEQQLAAAAGRCDVLAVGCGWGVGAGQKDLLAWALGQSKPLVCDADGLNNLAGLTGWANVRACPLVLTPHPRELSRLTGRDVGDIQADRTAAAVRAVLDWAGPPAPGRAPLVVLLKGAGTVVTDGRRVYLNETGNPGMASGGTGDVLTGLVAALIGQGMLPFEATCLAAHVHGLAGDLAAEALGQVGMIASDLLDYLPAALGEAHGRSAPTTEPVIDVDTDEGQDGSDDNG